MVSEPFCSAPLRCRHDFVSAGILVSSWREDVRGDLRGSREEVGGDAVMQNGEKREREKRERESPFKDHSPPADVFGAADVSHAAWRNRRHRSSRWTGTRVSPKPGPRGRRPQLAPWLKFSSTVAFVFSKSHCWVGEDESHVFMKTRFSPGLQSTQL